MDPIEQDGLPESMFAGYRILVADDNPLNRQLAARMLEKFGCQADEAGTGREAVLMHASRTYDLLLMDCRMPEMDGYQATRHIRAYEQAAKRTPIVALTASSTADTRRECAAAGMDDFLAKPIRQASLKDVLGRWLLFARLPTPLEQPGVAGDELETIRTVIGPAFGELAMLYRRDSTQRVRVMMDAAGAGDAAQLGWIAHQFCGSSASIGAMHLSALCKQLELCARHGRMNEAGRLLEAIAAEYARIDTKLQSLAG